MTDRPDLSALLGSRICHDLISPLGAIGNGVELLSLDSGDARRPEVALIAEAVSSANARIRFLRVAFGQASAEHRMGRPEIIGLLADWTHGGRLKVDWQVAGDLSRAVVRQAFLALLCLEAAVPFGGMITVGADTGRWTFVATGRRVKIEPLIWDMLAAGTPTAGLTPAQVQFGLLAQDLAHAGKAARIRASDSSVTLEIGPGP